jgi:GNAT superfamily N-acetyltransferase
VHHISDYRDRQDFGPQIADRVWNAWWKGAGLQLADVAHHLTEMVDERPLPTALVAHDDNGYAGSVFLIDSDLEERPQLTPWIAALWVEEEKRSLGVAKALVREATSAAARLGHDEVFVCCHRDLEPFYAMQDWRILERGVGPHDLSVLVWRA